MTRRNLDEKEKSLALKSIDRLEEEKKELLYSIEYDELMLNKGLNIQFNRVKKQTEKKLKEATNQLNEINATIKELKNQIVNGVEVKNNE